MQKVHVEDISVDVSFLRTGADIQKAIYAHVKNSLDPALQELTDGLSATLQNADHAVAFLIAVTDGYGLSSKALAVKSVCDKASQLTKQIRDLSCVAKNIMPEVVYRVSLEDAQRFGL
tara:strand:- start:8975 stop:9328 length:354 start_codon:yes stop_codon:yes gene_type:complete